MVEWGYVDNGGNEPVQLDADRAEPARPEATNPVNPVSQMRPANPTPPANPTDPRSTNTANSFNRVSPSVDQGTAGSSGPMPGRLSAATLLPGIAPDAAEPATRGWKGRMRRLTGGLISPRPGPEEMQWRESRAAVRQSFTRPLTIVFANPKGGAGKTPATACAAATFGVMRGGGVAAWDNNETRGTLAVRTEAEPHSQTVWDLLANLEWFDRPDARLGDLDRFLRNQGESHFDVLASDEHPGNMAQIGGEEFGRIRNVLARFYRLMCIDTGNNVRAPNWQAAIEAADMLVVCTSWRRDDAYTAAWMLDHLERSGHQKLAARAVTVVSNRDRRVEGALRDQVLDHFRARTASVMEIPYDPHLAVGERITYSALAPMTRDAWLYACAAIAHGLALVDHTTKEIRLP